MKYTYLELAKMIDHALLHPTMTDAEAVAGCEMAVAYDIATVCVKPYWVPRAAQVLAGSDVLVSCVVGFPAGNSASEVKRYETQIACATGAREIDMVINVAKALEHDWGYLENEIRLITTEAHQHGAKLKVIFENDYLPDDAVKIRLCEISAAAGADWVKTSTGFGFVKQPDGALLSRGATEHDLRLMRQHSPAQVQVKASGGIRDLDGLILVRDLGCTRLGTSATKVILDEYKRRTEAGQSTTSGPQLGAGGY
jgi:deoxyribose-phosphate aldolase